MTRIAVTVAALVVSAGLLQTIAQEPTRSDQTFRTGADVVVVDVSVRRNGRQVTGLTERDFVVTDNGIRQRIESVEATTVPIDLTLVADVSADAFSADRTPARTAQVSAQLQREVDEINAQLRPADRIRVLAVDRHAQLVVPWTPAGSPLSLRAFASSGVAALYDTLAAALLHPSPPGRRHVVIARTRGFDNISSIDAEAVGELAERADALVQIVMMESAGDNEQAIRGFRCRMFGLCWPTANFWIPFQRRMVGPAPVHQLTRDGELIASGVDASGGELHKAYLLTVPSLAGTFARTMEEFRSGYVLRYSPTGLMREGWHTIDVKVPGLRGATVRARRGYGIDVDRPETAAPKPPDVPRTLDELTAAYERRAYWPVQEGLRQHRDLPKLLREFEAAGNPWPASPRLEATFALEILEGAAFSSRQEERDQAYAMLARFANLVRHPLEPDVFERYWYFAAITMLDGTVRGSAMSTLVARALDRFPDEPRFLLARAIAADLALTSSSRSLGPLIDGSVAVLKDYDAAMAASATATEARIRAAHLLHRTGEHQAALEQLAKAGASAIEDPYLRYLHALFKGHALNALHDRHGAIASYRAAFEVIPGQSARVALMNTLLLAGDREGAERLAEEIQSAPQPRVDPWWSYWQGQYRFYPQALARLREMSR